MEATEQQQILEELRAINAKLDRIVGPPSEPATPPLAEEVETAISLLRAVAGRLGITLVY